MFYVMVVLNCLTCRPIRSSCDTLNDFYSLSPNLVGQSVYTEPTDQTVSAGEFAFFACSPPSTLKELPLWVINFENYHYNELPRDHWFNETGLLVLATEDKHHSSYQCNFISVILNADNSTRHESVSLPSNPAILTVMPGI